jgi:hypothetical protein
MGGAPQVAMRVTSQIWQIVFALQTLQVFCFCFANPLGFSFGPSQKGTICSSVCHPKIIAHHLIQIFNCLYTTDLE